MAKNLNWDEMTALNYIEFEDGTPKTLVVTNWRQQDRFKNEDGTIRNGLIMDVTEEDGVACKKEWTLTARKALLDIRVFLENVPTSATVKLRITRVGEGKNTQYSIKAA